MAKFNFREVWSFTRQMFSEFADDNVMSRAAALAYYTIFSLAPILVIIITAAGFSSAGRPWRDNFLAS